MALIKNTVTGDANALKAVKDGRNHDNVPDGGTEWANGGDGGNRPGVGGMRENNLMKDGRGNIDDAPITEDMDANAPMGAKVSPANKSSNSVTRKGGIKK